MELSIYAKVAHALYEYEKLVRDEAAIGKTWDEFLEQAHDEPVLVGYELADMATDLFPELLADFNGLRGSSELVNTAVRLAQDWLVRVG